jgi:WD40 repeat protein
MVWDLAGRRATQVFEGRGRPISSVAVSPDCRWLAAGDTRGLLRLWELGTGRYRDLAGHESGVRSVVFSTDNLHLLAADAGGLIVQWDVGTGKRDFPLLHHREASDYIPGSFEGTNVAELGVGTIAAYGPGGRTIVSVAANEWVMVWDAATHRRLDQVRINTNVNAASISSDGRQLALGTESAAIDILDIERLHERPRVIPAGGRRATMTFSPNGETLATRGLTGGVRLLDVRSGHIRNMFDNQINGGPNAMAFGVKGRRLAMAVGAEIHVVRVARDLDGTTVADNLGPIRRLAASPDGRWLALGREDRTIAVWDVRAGGVIRTLSGHDLAVFGLAFVPGPGGPRLVSVGGDGSIRTWDPEAGDRPLRTLGEGTRAVYAVAVRIDGRQIATGGQDQAVRTWDPVSGRPDLRPIDHGGPVSALAYDSAGTVLASGGLDRTVRVWSASSGGRRLGPLAHTYPISCLAFSPDGRLLAAGGGAAEKGGEVWVWDASSGRVLTTIDCQRGVDSLSFSPDSLRIATCGPDTVVQVWDATGGHETLSLQGHRDRVVAVFFAPHAQRLYSAGRDGVVKLWDGGTTAPAE